jgi:hypothetical protein
MKPDWKEAPAWANYLAMDEYGIWCWFEAKPSARVDGWFQGGISVKTQRLEPYYPDWEATLEQRPEK